MSLVMQPRRFHGFPMLSSAAVHGLSSTRIRIIKIIKCSIKTDVKNVFWSARKKERVKVPTYEDGFRGKDYTICEFLNHPTGIETVLNINALESWELLGSNTYRCKLPRIQLLSFEVSPLVVLQVNPTDEDCTVELLSCKFEGSDIVEKQNEHFSASMKNHITWDTSASGSFLNVDVNLKIGIEIYHQSFLVLPVSAIEVPGNIVMQALLDRFVPLLVQQLLQDYENWVLEQSKGSS